jgi:hypothetical protein
MVEEQANEAGVLTLSLAQNESEAAFHSQQTRLASPGLSGHIPLSLDTAQGYLSARLGQLASSPRKQMGRCHLGASSPSHCTLHSRVVKV